MPDCSGWVDRDEHIYVQALDMQGKEQTFWVDGMASICIQHEIDHLDGKLFTDRIKKRES